MKGERESRIKSCAQEKFDLIVIGAGISGAGIARDAQLRGLKTLIIDKGDFASGTSSRSGKLIHGGLRYLRSFQLKLVYEACRERYYLNKILAPHLVRKVRFFLPFYPNSKTSRGVTLLGLLLYRAMSLFKGFGFVGVHSRSSMLKLFPSLKELGLKGGLSYWDCAANDARLTIDTLISFESAGGQLCNYLELESIRKCDDQGYKLKVRSVCNTFDQGDFEFKTKAAVFALGPWSDIVFQKLGLDFRHNLTLSSGIHLFFTAQRLPISHTISIEAIEDHRPLYIVPWKDYALVGTTERRIDECLDLPSVQQADIDYLMSNLNEYFPGLDLKNEDILGVTVGVRPLIGQADADKMSATDISRDYDIKQIDDNLYSITGGKLTTYRAMAQDMVDRLAGKSRSSVSALRTEAGEPRAIGEALSLEDISHFVIKEWALNLSDILYRRTDFALRKNSFSKEELRRMACRIAQELGHDQEWVEQEIDRFQNEFGMHRHLFANEGK